MKNKLFEEFFEKAGLFGLNHITPTILTGYFSDVPLLFSGPAGTGKTSATEILAECEEKIVEKIECAHITLEMLLGLPKPKDLNEDKLSWVGGLKTKNPDIVILDELSRTSPAVQGYLHEFVRTGMLGSATINCKRVATCNPPSVEMMTSFLDYALATRFSIIEFPNPSMSAFTQIIDNIQTAVCIPIECKAFIKRLMTIQNTRPSLKNQAKVIEIAKKVVPKLQQYSINHRQIKNMMVLLLKAAVFEEAGIHSYLNTDIAFLIASVIPSRLVKISSVKDSTMKTIMSSISSELPRHPFEDELKMSAHSFAQGLQDLQGSYNMSGLADLIPAYVNNSGSSVEIALMRSAIINKLIDSYPNILEDIPWSKDWETSLKTSISNLIQNYN